MSTTQLVAAPALTADEARTIGVDACVYFYPLILMDLTRKQSINILMPEFGKGPMNMFVNVPAYPPADLKGLVRSNYVWIIGRTKTDQEALRRSAAARRYSLMPEAGGANIEIATHLSEHAKSSEHVILEIAEALVLAIVAIATAWSGYQAALWTGHQSELYGQASKLRVQAEGAATYANQERLYNASTVVEWLKAEAQWRQEAHRPFRKALPSRVSSRV